MILGQVFNFLKTKCSYKRYFPYFYLEKLKRINGVKDKAAVMFSAAMNNNYLSCCYEVYFDQFVVAVFYGGKRTKL